MATIRSAGDVVGDAVAVMRLGSLRVGIAVCVGVAIYRVVAHGTTMTRMVGIAVGDAVAVDVAVGATSRASV